MSETKPCFVIAPIGEPESDTRKRSDQVLKHIIRPAVESCGYEAVRADEIDRPGIITSQVIQRVVSDPLVIADLTERNPNVFYELAVRHALRKPLIQMIQKGERIPFDVAGTRTVQFDHHDLDSVETARKEIVEQIKSLEQDTTDIETPISVSLDLQILRQSDKPEERSLADLLSAISDLRDGLARLDMRAARGARPESLEEVKESIKEMSSKLDELASSSGPLALMRGRFHPMMFREMLHMTSRGHRDPIGIAMLASFFRDALPWVYESGIEAYRKVKAGDSAAARKALEDFRSTAEASIHSPIAHEMFGRRGHETFFMMEEMLPAIDEFISGSSPSHRRRTSKSEE